MDAKLDKIQEDVTEIRVMLERHDGILERNTADLKHHIVRTDALQALAERIHDDIKFWKRLGVLAVSLVGVVGGLLGIIEFFR